MGLSGWPLLTHEEKQNKAKERNREAKEFPSSSHRKNDQDNLNSLESWF